MEKTIHLDKEKFKEIESGKKNFEVRLGNKEINIGDTLIIKNRSNQKEILTKKVNFTLNTKDLQYWSKEDKNKFGFKIIQFKNK